jgi:hypothetical protein
MQDSPMAEIAQLLFDTEAQATVGAEILGAVLQAQSARWTEIARAMDGTEAAAYKRLQRFMAGNDLKTVLARLHDPQAAFVIGDPTEVPRPHAQRTDYVGYLKDGKTRGFWMLMLATPYRGRALPCSFVTYSSQTIADQATSRNQYHFQAFAEVKDLLGERPLVLDREFSYLGLLRALVAEQVQFVIRLNLSGPHAPHFTTAEETPIELRVLPGHTEIYSQVYYKGEVPVNVIGIWEPGFRKPLWVMTSLAPETGLAIYQQRMKIELSFRDLKSLLGLTKVMNRHAQAMQQTLALMALAFAIGLVTGELLRDLLYGDGVPQHPQPNPPAPNPASRKWQRYSGLFLLLKCKLSLSPDETRALISAAFTIFRALLFPPVRTLVQT